VTPPIIASVLEHGAPDPVHRIATMGFFKFKGTDQRLEADGPEGLADALHETLNIAQAAFEAEDIALLYVDVDANGGKLFCSSGVPLTSEDDEGRMLRAARAVMDANPPLPLHVGIHRGHVFAGELGAPDQAVFSIMGDTVNTAARIMVTAGPGVIHAHPAVLEAARVRYDTEPEGPFTFKGKALPQVVFRVGEELGPREVADGDELPFIGRQAEVAALRRHIEAVENGHGGVVTLVGATGLGKSRVLRHALGKAHPPLVDMHAEPYGASNSYRIVRDPLRSLFGLSGTNPADLAEQLRRTVRATAPHLEPFVPLLADALQLPVPSTPESDMIASEARAGRTADVVLELSQAMHDAPIVFIAEDMQWADDASAHLLRRIGEATDSLPWLLVVLRRADDGGLDPDFGERITIDPLSDDEVRELAINATEATPLRPHELDLVVTRAAGSPMFVGELIAAAQELGSLDAVPSSLQGTLAAQVDALDPLSKRMLSYASVLGRSFRRVIVDELLRREGLELDEATITQLSRFLEADGPLRYRFKNGLVCDVVYDSLAYRARARLHLAAGEAFESLASGDEAEVAMLSLHFSQSEDHERAYRYARAAAERADRTHAITEAIIHYERAIDAARRTGLDDSEIRRLLLALGNARRAAGLYEAGLEAYRRAARIAGQDRIARAEIHLRRAQTRDEMGQFPLALAETTRGRRLAASVAGKEGESVEAKLLAQAAMSHAQIMHSKTAQRLGLAAAELAERHGELGALARALHALYYAESNMDLDSSAMRAREAFDLYGTIRDFAGQAAMAGNLGVIAYYDNRWDETIEWYQRSGAEYRRIGLMNNAACVEMNIGEVLLNQGRLDEAESLLRDALRVLRSSNSSETPFVEMQLGRLLTARGELSEAERLLRAGVDLWKASGDAWWAYEMSLHLADCLVRSGRSLEALDVLDDLGRVDPSEVAVYQAAKEAVLASAFVELGRDQEAVEAICRGVEVARRRSLTFDLSRLLLLADRIGPPFDPRLGTDQPVEEANELLDRLGVVRPAWA
jgi:tetratricopeptide (TPR) repeat protein